MESRSDHCRVTAGLLIRLLRLLVLLEQTLKLCPSLTEESVNNNKWLANNTRNAREPGIREQPDHNSPRQTNHRGNNGNSPLRSVKTTRVDLESTRSDKDNGNLQSNHEDVDDDEELIAVDTFEDVELVVETTVVELVEDLHPYEGVEDDGVELKHLVLGSAVVAEDFGADEVED